MAKEYPVVWTEPHFVYHSSVSGHLCCFLVLALMDNAAVNMYVQGFVGAYVFKFLGVVPIGMESLGHVVIVCLTF